MLNERPLWKITTPARPETRLAGLAGRSGAAAGGGGYRRGQAIATWEDVPDLDGSPSELGASAASRPRERRTDKRRDPIQTSLREPFQAHFFTHRVCGRAPGNLLVRSHDANRIVQAIVFH